MIVRPSSYSNVSHANGISGRARVGSQRRQTPGDNKPRPASVTAGERHAGRYLATLSDCWGLYGMQEARGSSPLSSTFPQFKGLL
jgi:hypothetical protein